MTSEATMSPYLGKKQRAEILTALTASPQLELGGHFACAEAVEWLRDAPDTDVDWLVMQWRRWLGSALAVADMIEPPLIPISERANPDCELLCCRHAPIDEAVEWYYPKNVLMDGVRRWITHQKKCALNDAGRVSR